MDHKIRMFADILKATNVNNVDNFLRDLKDALLSLYAAREHSPNIQCEEFTWTDDSKHNINIDLKITDNE